MGGGGEFCKPDDNKRLNGPKRRMMIALARKKQREKEKKKERMKKGKKEKRKERRKKSKIDKGIKQGQ